MGNDTLVTLPRAQVDELFRSSIRVLEEHIRLTDAPVHDGTRCILVPQAIFDRFKTAVASAEQSAPKDWRP